MREYEMGTSTVNRVDKVVEGREQSMGLCYNAARSEVNWLLWRREATSIHQRGQSMDAETILATARSGDAPGTWVVWPLRRTFMRNSSLKWLGLSVVGFGLFIPVLLSTVPGIFSTRGFAFVLTGIIILALGAVAFGALSIAGYDAWRLLHADDYWLVVTPDDYVKAEPGNKVTHVPLEYVESVTLKGVRAPIETAETPFDATGRGVNPLMRTPLRLSNYRRQRATPISLGFVDSRTGKVVVVATDAAFDDLHGIEYVLSMQADAKQRQVNRSRKG
jgi:hypothetical protein